MGIERDSPAADVIENGAVKVEPSENFEDNNEAESAAASASSRPTDQRLYLFT